ncbi:hypothetical protein [Hymenobacter pini]|uniref:hypothetical protein n=1 Tax=Hymenobacter pini TaxID=2880879 RepID=UPI001CF405BB|nr:hypothetical protein [Hymenobacter pini]MCA8829386.1 hypothetical protein [Hymenobacter pini]
MHYLPFPRRRYRALFFPPGLLALAGLLWLGCVAVPRIVPPKKAVMEIAVWSPKMCSVDFDAPSSIAAKWRASPACLSPTALENFRPWYTSQFTGSIFSDYFSLQKTRFIARDLQQKPNQNRGFRVYFAPSATYANFVQLLDLLNQESVSRHWIDLYHLPVTIYSYTEKPLEKPLSEEHNDSLRDWSCLLCGDTIPYIPTAFETITHWLKEQWAAILSIDWRNTWLLLLLLTALSTWKLRQQWRTAS